VSDESAIVSRYGGDEFVIILPDSSESEGLRIAEDIRKAIEDNVFLEHAYGFGMPARHLKSVLTASIGVAHYAPGRSRSLEIEKNDILRRADSAMYQAKTRGKNLVIVAGAAEAAANLFGAS
jgi:diguanylate cyclase (GGDEF)-like protein